MLAMSTIVSESRDYGFWTKLKKKQIFDDCKNIWSPLKEIASINIRFRIRDCKHKYLVSFESLDRIHIRSSLLLTLQAY